jgi:hypothetical protein
MKNTSFYFFLLIFIAVSGSYIFLEYFKSGSTLQKGESTTLNERNTDTARSTWGHSMRTLQASDSVLFSFELPHQWQTSVSEYSPPGPPPINSGFEIEIKHPQNKIQMEWFAPLRFHFYLGDLGKYLNRQRKPVPPLAALDSFFGHPKDSCHRIPAPFSEWTSPKSQTAEYYSEVHAEWFRVEGLDHPTIYYIKIEKAPTPGVYGDLGSWTFSAFRFTLIEGDKIREKDFAVARNFYETFKRKEIKAEAQVKS